jgi:hypothetical protein
MEAWIDAVGSEMSQAVRPTEDGRLSAVGAVTMEDVSGVDSLLDGTSKMLKAMSGLQEGQPGDIEATITQNAAEHNGVALHEIAMQIELPEAQPGMPPVVVAMQQAVFELMGGTDSTSYAAFLDDTYVYSQGADTLEAIKAIIDGDTSLADSEDLATARQKAGEDAVLFGFVAVDDLSNALIEFAQAQMAEMGQPVPAEVQNIRLDPADPLTFSSGVIGGDTVTARVEFPTSIAVSIMKAITELQQAQGGAGARPGTGPALP